MSAALPISVVRELVAAMPHGYFRMDMVANAKSDYAVSDTEARRYNRMNHYDDKLAEAMCAVIDSAQRSNGLNPRASVPLDMLTREAYHQLFAIRDAAGSTSGRMRNGRRVVTDGDFLSAAEYKTLTPLQKLIVDAARQVHEEYVVEYWGEDLFA